MIRSNRDCARVGRRDRCSYGCCDDHLTARQERRLIRHREKVMWRKDFA